jgi:cyclic beta-1,2-glucan synthetase
MDLREPRFESRLKQTSFCRRYVLIVIVISSLVQCVFDFVMIDSEPVFNALLPILFCLVPSIAVGMTVAAYVVNARCPTAVVERVRQGQAPLLKTVVLIPVIVRSERDVELSLQALRDNAIADLLLDMQYVLVVDFDDASECVLGTDDTYRDGLLRGCKQLNHLMAKTSARVAIVFRARTYNAVAGKWMGWERKRGKLIDVMTAIRAGSCSAFDGASEFVLDNYEAVITLDRDSRVMPGSVAALMAVASHPSNLPVVEHGRVIQGYALVAPRVVRRAPTKTTWFYRLNEYDSQTGSNEGTRPDLLQDGLGRSMFFGKGLIRISPFLDVISPAIRENRVLSHDHLEGLLGRCCLASDILVSEENPIHWSAWRARQSRWVRGDFQLLPWVVSGHDSTGRFLTLGKFDRWILAENFVRHTQPIFSLFLIAVLALSDRAGEGVAVVILLSSLASFAGVVIRWLMEEPAISRMPVLFKDSIGALKNGLVSTSVSLSFLFVNAVSSLLAIGQAIVVLAGNGARALDWDVRASWGKSIARKALFIAAYGLCIVPLTYTKTMSLTLMALVFLWGASPLLSMSRSAGVWKNRSSVRRSSISGVES